MTVTKINHFIEYLKENRNTRKKHKIESVSRQEYFESKKQERQRLKKEKEYKLLNPKWKSQQELDMIEIIKKEVKK